MKQTIDKTTSFDHVLEDLRLGRLVLLVDDCSTPAPVYLIAQASSISAEDICTMVNYGGGLICAALADDRLNELGLPPMCVERNNGAPDFTVSVEARQGVTTGISASDRARTLRTLAKTTSAKLDLVTPGHIFPIRTKQGGVLVRNSYPEAAVDLMRLSGGSPVAAVCGCLTEDGSIADDSTLDELLNKTGLNAIAVSDIIRHRLATEFIVEKISQAQLPTQNAGVFLAYCFRSSTDGAEHLALVKGEIDKKDEQGRQIPVTVRVQAENRIGDLLGTQDILSRERIHGALRKIDELGRGVFIYVRRQPSPLSEVLRKRERKSSDTTSRLHEYGIGAQILNYLGAKRITLLTNSVRDMSGISAFQIEIVDRIGF